MDASLRPRPFRPLLAAAALAIALLAAGCSGASETTTAPADSVLAGPEVPRTLPDPTPAQRRPGLDPVAVQAVPFDQGRLWTFENPPEAYFQEAYDLDLTEEWLRRARLGALRIPGCTASFASPHGLMLTNHHCARSHAAQVTRPGEDLLEEGFYAETLGEERRAEGLYADQLIAIEDVTQAVTRALEGAQTDAERAEAREAAFAQIEQERIQAAGGGGDLRAEVAALYDGARYSAYTYRRYDDVRLVMLPELDVGYFGGDPDNFTYPRYTLDMALFRVYDDQGEPLDSEYYFPWNEDGAQEGEAVFVVGNPGSTLRLSTVAQLRYRRDVQERAFLDYLNSRVQVLEAFAEEQPEEAARLDLQNSLFGLQNAQKLYRGRLAALRDPYVLARRAAAEEAFRDSLMADTSLRAQYGGVLDSLAALQQERRTEAGAYRAFVLMGSGPASVTLQRALAAYPHVRRQQNGAAGSSPEEWREAVLSVSAMPDALDRRLLAARLEDFEEYLGEEVEALDSFLQGRTPEAAARAVVEGSVLSDSARAAEALQNEALSMDDPALQLAGAIFQRYQDYQSARAGLGEQEVGLARQLGRARFALYGTDVPPDATFTLRLSDGRVRGYPYNGTVAPAFTSMSGLYGHYHAYGDGTPWDLPARWLDREGALDLSTSLNLVSSNDITGGNSGSPLLNEDLELVGLVFDGNIESLGGAFIFLPDRMRAVSVDVRAMLEALRTVYDAERLLPELLRGELVPSDAAAASAR